MLKQLFAVILISLLLPVSVLATTPRTSALGGDTNFFLDDTSVLRWYAHLPDYGNQAFLETGQHDLTQEDLSWQDSPSSFGTGLNLDLGPEGSWGTAAIYYNARMRDSDVSTTIVEDPENCLTVMYGKNLGPVQLGVSLRHGSREWTAALDTVGGYPMTHREYGRTTIGLGLRADLSEASYLDFGIDLHQMKWSDLGNSTWDDLPDEWGNISLRARAFVDLGSNLTLVPVLEYQDENFLHTDERFPAMWEIEYEMSGMGCGLSYAPNSDVFLLVSADFRDINRVRDFLGSNHAEGWGPSDEFEQIKVLLAAESKILPWITLRGSAGFLRFQADSNYYSPFDDEIKSTDFPINLGAGFHLGDFDLDVAMASHEQGNSGPNWATVFSDTPSTQTVGSWFSGSVKYDF